jgi:hypothetical protein
MKAEGWDKSRQKRTNLLVYWLGELYFRGWILKTNGFVATIFSIVAKTRSF